MRVVLLITPLRSNLASTAKHHASAVDAMVRSCVSRARESVDEALGRAERDNDSTSTCAAARVKFEFGSVREPETTPVPDRRHFLPTRARDEILLLGVFSRERLVTKRRALPPTPSSRVAPPRARRVACPRHARGPRPVIARGRGVSSALRRGLLETFFSRLETPALLPRAALRRKGGKTSEVQKVGVAT